MKRYLQLLSFNICMALLIDIPKHVLPLYNRFYTEGGELEFPPPKILIIEKSVQIVNDDKYPLTFPRFVDASIDPPPPPKPEILYETLMFKCYM